MRKELSLTDRQRILVGMALRYAKANVDDVNDCFADEDEDDEIQYAGELYDSVDSKEFDELLGLLGED